MKTYKRTIFILILLCTLFQTVIAGAEEFVIGPEDVLNISVWGTPELTLTLPVRPDGKISFPLVGDITAAGSTPSALRDSIKERLVNFVNKPEVSVIVTAINSYKIFIYGEVIRPGVISMARYTTLLQLFSMVGGVTKNADLKRAKLIRDNKDEIKLDFEKLIRNGDISYDIFLKQGDTLFIPDNFEDRISITGEVIRPGIIPYQNGLTILDAVLMVGGITNFASGNDTIIYRKQKTDIQDAKDPKDAKDTNKDAVVYINVNGVPIPSIPVVSPKENKSKKSESKNILKVKLKDIIKNGKIGDNIELEPGDVVIVPESLF